MTPLTQAQANEVLLTHVGYSDNGAEGARETIRDVAAAIEETRATGGRAALEIGVRKGGTSGVFCHVADILADTEFVVIGVDPWGEVPYYNPALSSPGYGEDYYIEAKKHLAPSRRSVLFRMEADDFLGAVLPRFTWWVGGSRYPASPRFISYAFVDGQHEPTHVVREVSAIAPHMAPGGRVVVDNAETVPTAIDLLAKSQALGLRYEPGWKRSDGNLWRAVFAAPREG